MAALYEIPRFRTLGDSGLIMEFGSGISPSIHRLVKTMFLAVKKKPIQGVLECTVSYRSLSVFYNPLTISHSTLTKALQARYDTLNSGQEAPPPKVVEIPVCYGGRFGPDIDHVARHNQLTVADVVNLHSSGEYLVYMLGFSPGFPFLGGLSEKLHTPRLESPRKVVPAGSVGIANDQTGVYPISSPGGWQLIGRTPLALFDVSKESPCLLESGNILKFKPISKQDFVEIESAANQPLHWNGNDNTTFA